MSKLVSLTTHPGAHIVHTVREYQDINGEKTTIADVQLIGAQLPFSVPIEQVKTYHPAVNPFKYTEERNKISDLAQEAVTVYGLDPKRIIKADEIVRSKGVKVAHRDADGNEIKPSHNVLAVVGRKGWHTVRRGECTCEDHRFSGQVCKHRIAAWMYRETIVRAEAYARASGARIRAARVNADPQEVRVRN